MIMEVMKSRMDDTARFHPILDIFIPKLVILFNFCMIFGMLMVIIFIKVIEYFIINLGSTM